MSVLTVTYALLFYVASAVLVIGLALRIRLYLRAPAPLKIPTTPAPTTGTGVALRMAREVLWFESLFKSNKWTWAFGWLFHAGLLLVLLRHGRYFQEPVWTPIVAASFDDEALESFGEDNPMGRPAQPVELAPAFVFLASDESRFVNGAVIGVTGGKPLA